MSITDDQSDPRKTVQINTKNSSDRPVPPKGSKPNVEGTTSENENKTVQITTKNVWLAIIGFSFLMLFFALGSFFLLKQLLTNNQSKVVEKSSPTSLSENKPVWQNLTQPSANSLPGLELPPPMEVPSSSKYVLVTARCKSEVKWLISSSAKLEILESKPTNMVMIFPGSAELITVVAYTAIDGKPSEPAVTFIRIVPDKEKLPLPSIPKKEKENLKKDELPAVATNPNAPKHITFVSKDNKSKTVNDAIKSWAKQNDIELHEHLVTSSQLEGLGLKQYLEKPGVPLVVIQDGNGHVLYAEKYLNLQQVKDAVGKLPK